MDYKDVLPLQTLNWQHSSDISKKPDGIHCSLFWPSLFQLLYSEFIITDKTQISTSNTHLLESQFITQTSALKVLYMKMLQRTLHKCSVNSACCGTV
jgi:hypothetical protein